eukprot:GEZU01011700.1.p1 GENE.GEZU01011700.1~~GEZU01011700.1.p1  ORF type:complete len:266 (-),score=80.52 GEZU01011700.1:66-863(-)
MADSLVWADLSSEQLDCLTKVIHDPPAVKRLLETYNSRNESEKLNAILMDFYYYNLVFAIESGFSYEKISAFFSIMKLLHNTSMKNVYTMEESFSLFQKLLVNHSVYRPPYSIQVFSLHDIKTITDYVISRYFMHYKLYIYTFCKKQEAELRIVCPEDLMASGVPTAPIPLSQGIKEEDWLKQQQEAERKRQEEEEELQRQQELKALQDQLPESVKGSIQTQLEDIKKNLSKMTADKMSELEKKLAEIESKIAKAGQGTTQGAAK